MARAAQHRTDRRAHIARALYRCISKQGYANTSLREIADRAGMSPSHIGYYFDNKAAILEYYATWLCEQVLAGLPDPEEPDLERLLESIARCFLGEGQVNTSLLGVVQEISGLAVHDAALNRIKTRHSTTIRGFLEAVFERTARATGLPAREAAWRAHAMVVGLDSNTLFDPDMSRDRAFEIFHQTLRSLAGLERRSRKDTR